MNHARSHGRILAGIPGRILQDLMVGFLQKSPYRNPAMNHAGSYQYHRIL